MHDREKVISTLEEIKTQTAEIGLNSAVIAHEFIDKVIVLLKEQEQTINELKEKLRLLEYGDQDILQSGMMPAT